MLEMSRSLDAMDTREIVSPIRIPYITKDYNGEHRGTLAAPFFEYNGRLV